MPSSGALHHVELQAIDLGPALDAWGWLLTRLGHREHQRWADGASWIHGDAYVVVARASTGARHDRRGGGLNHLAFHVGGRADVDRIWHEADSHGWRRLSDANYRWSRDGDAESAFLESDERMKVELVATAERAGEPPEGKARVETRHLSVVIRRDWREVAAFAGDPARLPQWAAGLAEGEPVLEGGVLRVASPMGQVRVRFAPRNDLGVLDHDVTLPDGQVVHNPLRVLAHPQGAEVVFTLRRLPGVAADAFEADRAAVQADLERLRSLLQD